MKARFLLVVAISFAVILALLPVGIQYGLVRQVGAMGYGNLTIGNTDFNLFTLKLELHDYALGHRGNAHVDGQYALVDLEWLPLLQGRIGIEAVSIDGLELWVRETADGQWFLLPEPSVEPGGAGDSVESEAGPGIEYLVNALSIDNARIHVDGQQLKGDFELPAFRLEDLTNRRELAGMTTTNTRALWNGADIAIRTSKSLMDESPPLKITFTMTDLPLEDFQGIAGLPQLSGLLDMELEIRGKLSRSPLVSSGDPLNVELDVQAGLAVRDLNASDPDGQFRISSEMLAWQGTSTVSFDPEGVRIETTGDIEAGKTGVRLQDATVGSPSSAPAGNPGLLLASWDQLSLDAVRIDSSNQLAIGAVEASGLALLGQDTPLVSVDVSAEQIAYVPARRATMASLSLNNLDARVEINEAGEIPALVRFSEIMATNQGEESGATTSATQEPEAGEMTFRLGSLAINGTVFLADHSVSPAFEQTLMIEELGLTALDTGDPALSSDLVLRSRLDDYSRFDIDASLAGLTTTRLISADITLTQLPLDRLSAYVEQALGYEVRTGQMDLQSTVLLEDEHLKAEIDTVLRKFRVKKAADSTLDGQLGMPLGAALALVRDNDDNITLNDILIEGNLGDPSVSVSSIITSAMSKALQAGAMTYFSFALQPYGAALMAAKAISSQAGKVALEPLQMEPGQPVIESGNSDYIERLSSLMSQRPGIHLVICGEASTVVDVPAPTMEAGVAASAEGKEADTVPVVISPAEQAERMTTLKAVADARASTVKSALFDAGVASDRLLICKSSINDSPDGARVVLSID